MKVVSKKNSPPKKVSSSRVNKIIKKVVIKKKTDKKILARKAKRTPKKVSKVAKTETKIKTNRTRSKKVEKVITPPVLEEVAQMPAVEPVMVQDETVAVPMILTEEPSVASDYYETLPGFITSPIISTSIDIAPQTEPHDTHLQDNHAETAVLERVEIASAEVPTIAEETMTYTEPIESIFTELEQILSKEPLPIPAPIAPKAHILKRMAIGFLHIFTKFAKRYPKEQN